MAIPKKKTPQSVSAEAKAIDWPFGKANYILFGLTLLVLLIGYFVLAKGSITLAPILLVIGYCVLLPLSIIYRGRAGASESEKLEPAAVRTEKEGIPTDQAGTGK
jgi:Ca2+/Na+ antiporter